MLGIQHESVGGIIGLIFASWLYILGHPVLGLGAFLLAIWGANLPDLIDPPANPFHRSVGHNLISLILFIFIFLISIGLSLIIPTMFLFFKVMFILIAAFSLGVLSHLLLDLSTPMGLPMFVGKCILGLLEIPLWLIPVINFIMIIVTIVLALYSIKFIAKKIGGIWAMILLFIPLWGSFLMFGLGLKTMSFLGWLGNFFIFLFAVTLSILALIGKGIDSKLQKTHKKKTST